MNAPDRQTKTTRKQRAKDARRSSAEARAGMCLCDTLWDRQDNGCHQPRRVTCQVCLAKEQRQEERHGASGPKARGSVQGALEKAMAAILRPGGPFERALVAIIRGALVSALAAIIARCEHHN